MSLTPAEVAEHLPPIAAATLQALSAEPEHQTEIRTRVCCHHPYGQRRFSVTPAGEEMQDLCYDPRAQAESAP